MTDTIDDAALNQAASVSFTKRVAAAQMDPNSHDSGRPGGPFRITSLGDDRLLRILETIDTATVRCDNQHIDIAVLVTAE